MKLSCVTSVLVNYLLPDAVAQIAEAGYEGVDIWAGRPHAYRLDYSEGELSGLRRWLDDHGLAVPSLMPAFYRYPHSLSTSNETVRQDSLEYMRRCADNAAILGAGILLVVPSLTLYGQSVEDARARLCDSIAEMAGYVRQYGLRLGLEPANRRACNLVNTAGDALDIINTLGLDNLGVVLDTGHVNLSGRPLAEEVAKLGPRLLQIHVNDNDGVRQQNAIPGDGTFDFGDAIAVLRRCGYDGFLSAELAWDYSADPVPAIRETARRMTAYLNGQAPSGVVGGL